MTKLRKNKDAQDYRRQDMEQRLWQNQTETVGRFNRDRYYNE